MTIEAAEPEQLPAEFECPVCMKMLLEPVSTICGHTFCRICLHEVLLRRAQCPLCRHELSEQSAGNPNKLLESIIRKTFPVLLSRRIKELKETLRCEDEFQRQTRIKSLMNFIRKGSTVNKECDEYFELPLIEETDKAEIRFPGHNYELYFECPPYVSAVICMMHGMYPGIGMVPAGILRLPETTTTEATKIESDTKPSTSESVNCLPSADSSTSSDFNSHNDLGSVSISNGLRRRLPVESESPPEVEVTNSSEMSSGQISEAPRNLLIRNDSGEHESRKATSPVQSPHGLIDHIMNSASTLLPGSSVSKHLRFDTFGLASKRTESPIVVKDERVSLTGTFLKLEKCLSMSCTVAVHTDSNRPQQLSEQQNQMPASSSAADAGEQNDSTSSSAEVPFSRQTRSSDQHSGGGVLATTVDAMRLLATSFRPSPTMRHLTRMAPSRPSRSPRRDNNLVSRDFNSGEQSAVSEMPLWVRVREASLLRDIIGVPDFEDYENVWTDWTDYVRGTLNGVSPGMGMGTSIPRRCLRHRSHLVDNRRDLWMRCPLPTSVNNTSTNTNRGLEFKNSSDNDSRRDNNNNQTVTEEEIHNSSPQEVQIEYNNVTEEVSELVQNDENNNNNNNNSDDINDQTQNHNIDSNPDVDSSADGTENEAINSRNSRPSRQSSGSSASASRSSDLRERLLKQSALNQPIICDGKALIEFSCPGRINVDLSSVKKSAHGFWLARVKFVFDDPLDMSSPFVLPSDILPSDNNVQLEKVVSECPVEGDMNPKDSALENSEGEMTGQTKDGTKKEESDSPVPSPDGQSSSLERYEVVWTLAKEIQTKLYQQILRAGVSGRTLFEMKHGPLWQLGLQPKSVDLELFSFWVCKVLTMPPQSKRHLVRITSTGDRMRALQDFLSTAGGANVLSLSLGTYDSSGGWSILLFKNTKQSLCLVIIFVCICALRALWWSNPEPVAVWTQRVQLSQTALQNRVLSALNAVTPDQQNVVNRLLREHANRFVAF